MSVRRISFEVTNACNLSCPHCLRDDATAKRYLKLEHLEKVLVQAKRYGTEIIILTGGEPLLHPQIEEMIARIAYHGYRWYIVTNGTLLDRLGRLVGNPEYRKKMTHLSVSLDGATEETNDSIRGPGHFRKVMKALSYAKAKGALLGFKMSINTANAGEMEGIVRLAAKLGAAFVEFSHMTPTPELVRSKFMLPRSQWEKIDKELMRLKSIYRTELTMCTGGRCNLTFAQCYALGMQDLHFDFDGNLSACCMLPNYRGAGPDDKKDIAGNIGEHDLWDLHSRLIGILMGVNRAKIRKIKNNTLSEADHYPCIFCLKHFGKLDWIRQIDPQNEWISDIVDR